ncbi:MAG: endonuclease III [Chloroflexota bacterium]|nr:endonuclease III [Chloroflexota bacterium]
MARRLEREYGLPRHGNPDDPLDDLIFVLLSQMTTGPSYERVFSRLKVVPGGWERVSRMRPATLAAFIKDAGLSNLKALRVLAILRRVRADFGAITLRELRLLPDGEAEEYLVSLPGVGPKTAKCVLLYTLGRRALPVDTHLGRLALRLRLVSSKSDRAAQHAQLESLVSPSDRYALHVGALAHGRAVCRARWPRCEVCVLADLCPSSASAGRGRLLAAAFQSA